MYGDEKVRQMVRSILPSSRRRSARLGKAKLNRRLRRNARQALSEIRSEEDWLDDDTDFWDDGEHERSWIVADRRGADKTNHFCHWAEVKAKDIPDGEKMDYIKGVIKGKGVIIEHAYSHLEWIDGFDKNPYSWRYSYRHRDTREVFAAADIRKVMQEILEDSWAHRKLNDMLKRHKKYVTWYVYEEVVTHKLYGESTSAMKYVPYHKTGELELLLGVHNVEKFLDFYRHGRPVSIRGDGKHYSKNYRGQYTQAWLPNPANQHHLCHMVMMFVELYRDHRDDKQAFEDLVARGNNNHYGEYSYYRSHQTRYKWEWQAE